jgi:uncharacterized protein YjeT (DUF2065 family)
MIQKKFAGMANRAIRIVAACAVLLVLEGVCPYGGKAAAQSTASEAEKKAQAQLKEIEAKLTKILGVAITPEELLQRHQLLVKLAMQSLSMRSPNMS